MTTLAVAAMICWLMVLVARPRKPLPGNEVQELVYSRLLGRQQMRDHHPLALHVGGAVV